MQQYTEDLQYQLYPLVQREWGYEIPILFRYLSTGRVFNFVMNFKTEPSENEVLAAISFLVAKTTAEYPVPPLPEIEGMVV